VDTARAFHFFSLPEKENRMEVNQDAAALREPIEPRPAFRKWAGQLKSRTQHLAHKIERGERPEFSAGMLAGTKQALEELQLLLRRDWRA
jgi:hypothetical protein